MNIKNKIITMFLVPVLVIATACDKNGQPVLNNQQMGTAVGAVGGGILGSTIGAGSGKTVATIGGAVLGGVVGSSVGSSMDKANSTKSRTHAYKDSMQNALEHGKDGDNFSWANADSSKTSVMVRNSFVKNGRTCRDFTQTNSNGSKVKGTACRSSDGVWR